jgi:hypothetical protein
MASTDHMMLQLLDAGALKKKKAVMRQEVKNAWTSEKCGQLFRRVMCP